MYTPKYHELPWAEIRTKYETAGATCEALKKEYGISSATVIKRRRDKEKWERLSGHPDAPPAPEPLPEPGAVHMGAPPPLSPESHHHSPPGRPVVPPPRPTDTVGGLAADTFGVPDGLIGPKPSTSRKGSGAHPRVDEASTGGGGGPSPASGPSPRTPLDLDFALRHIVAPDEAMPDVDGPGALERQRMVAASRQLRLGREVQDIGMRVLRAISIAVSSDDSMEAGESVRRLLSANADKDTLNTLLKAGVAAVEGGMEMERRALNMDQDKVVAAEQPASTAAVGGDGARALEALGRAHPDLVLSLRERVVAITRARPATAVIEERARQVEGHA